MFSRLQQHILRECHSQRGKEVDRKVFLAFYADKKIKPTLAVKIITKSLERLIDRGMVRGYGVRTPRKWFIKKVRLTSAGVKAWDKWLAGRQRRLPF